MTRIEELEERSQEPIKTDGVGADTLRGTQDRVGQRGGSSQEISRRLPFWMSSCIRGNRRAERYVRPTVNEMVRYILFKADTPW